MNKNPHQGRKIVNAYKNAIFVHKIKSMGKLSPLTLAYNSNGIDCIHGLAVSYTYDATGRKLTVTHTKASKTHTMSSFKTVEWSNVLVQKEGEISNIVGTSKKQSEVMISSLLRNNGYDILMDIHNHPRGKGPSLSDMEYVTKHSKSKTKYYLYIHEGHYFQYDAKGIIYE